MVPKWESRLLWIALIGEICGGVVLHLLDPQTLLQNSTPKMAVFLLFITTAILIIAMISSKQQTDQ